jgi:hypothetical protein
MGRFRVFQAKEKVMKWLLTMMIASVVAVLALPRVAVSEEPAREALEYLVGKWKGKIASEVGESSLLGNLGTSVYSGDAKPTKDGKSVLQIGSWSKVGLSGGVGWARLYKLGSKPNTMVIYTYSTRADHSIVEATVRPHGEFFVITGENTGVTTSRQLTASEFTLAVTDENHFTIKTTSRTVDGVAKPDEVLEYVRKKE